jgi:hypothetical protein
MSNEQMTDFYGHEPFVFSAPMRCNDCLNGWEVLPPKIACYLMIGLSITGIIIGAGLVVGALVVGLAGLLGAKGEVRPALAASLFLGAGIEAITACFFIQEIRIVFKI